jgi:sporulation protein YlmC with PRC-barrel domain
MNRLTHLQDVQVIAEDGTRLGRVYEIRSAGRAETEPSWKWRGVECLLCGDAGLLERLGWKQRRPFTVPWESVIAIGAREISVRGGADDYRRIG